MFEKRGNLVCKVLYYILFASKPKDTHFNACPIQVVGYLVVELFVPSRIEVA